MKWIFDFDDDEVMVLGVERMDEIHRVTLDAIEAQMNMSFALACSGALRHPRSLRPEVLISGEIRAL